MMRENLGRISGIRIPQPISIEQAVQTYYTKSELSNPDIKQLFGISANSTISKLKNCARTQMAADNATVFDGRNVSTKSAYQAWGLSIDDLEHRLEKLNKLKKLAL